MKDLSTLTERAKAVEESVEWWNLKMNQAIDEHEAAVESGDNEAQYSTAEKLKSLLRRAELEKIEMVEYNNIYASFARGARTLIPTCRMYMQTWCTSLNRCNGRRVDVCKLLLLEPFHDLLGVFFHAAFLVAFNVQHHHRVV